MYRKVYYVISHLTFHGSRRAETMYSVAMTPVITIANNELCKSSVEREETSPNVAKSIGTSSEGR